MSGRWIILPARALDDSELRNHPAAYMVLCALSTYASTRDGWCFPSQRTISDRLGVSRQAVQQHIKKLKDLGYLEIHPQFKNGQQVSSKYRIICDGDIPIDRDLSVKGGQAELAGGQAELVTGASSGTCTERTFLTNTHTHSPLTREEFLREIERERLAGRFERFNAPESVINLEASDCWDYWLAEPDRKPSGDLVAGFTRWLRQSKAISSIQKLAEKNKGAAEGVKAAEPSNPLQDWHKAIAQRVPEGVYRSWFRPMVLVGGECRAPSRFHADYVRQHFGKDFNAVLPGVKITVQPATATAKQE